VEVAAGCIVLLVALRAFRRRGRRAPSAETPKWLGRLDETNWLLAVLVGAFMLTYSLTLAAVAEILKAHVSTGDDLIAFAVFALASIASIVAPIVVVLVAPERSAERLAMWRAWLLGNSRAIGLVALMVIGALVAARGIHDLIA
jgi:vacuolar-type H+-ATPase subunit I/STV1